MAAAFILLAKVLVNKYSIFNKLETHRKPFRIKINVNTWKCIHTTALTSSSYWQAV